MRKAGIVGAFILAGLAAVPMMAGESAGEEHQAGLHGVVLTGSHIAHIKAALKLSAEQERYWPAVEAALRDIARHQGLAIRSHGFAHSAITLDAEGVQRLTSAAVPLFMTFREEQKREAMILARSLGLENVASAF